MPLLRQALYAQNVNLYLAPTADNRDAWLGLMRTVGVEGRCFVVSSNMCVRAALGNNNTGRSNGVGEGDEAAVGDGVDGGDALPYGEGRPGARRRSLVTEEGFEIALPAAATQGAEGGDGMPLRLRRKSVIDEHGNEIVLSGTGANGTTLEVNNIPSDNVVENGTAATKTAAGGEKFISRGGSSIVNPFGDVLAGPQWEDDEGILYADVDFKDCIRGRLDLDAAGSYSR